MDLKGTTTQVKLPSMGRCHFQTTGNSLRQPQKTKDWIPKKKAVS